MSECGCITLLFRKIEYYVVSPLFSPRFLNNCTNKGGFNAMESEIKDFANSRELLLKKAQSFATPNRSCNFRIASNTLPVLWKSLDTSSSVFFIRVP